MSTQVVAPITALPSSQSEKEQAAKLKKALLRDIHRSVYVFRVDTGGCNACDFEIFSAVTSVFDVERFGIKLVASPRDRKSTRLNSSHRSLSRMPSSA